MVAERLKIEGIQTSIHYPAIHRFSAFKRRAEQVNLPFTEAFASRELTLPLYPSLPAAIVDQIVAVVGGALATKPPTQTRT
jgi:dTDP-4-amino-4,6-dideoxygalactose transaminase